tara:strand:- start:5769 stop:5951 length:183 start_codon:yes stop_codon:yes gene_type:complete
MKDKRVLDYTNKSERECFDLWFAECPVNYEASDCFEDEDTETEWYFFRIKKEDIDETLEN